jgi:hypothetical protein
MSDKKQRGKKRKSEPALGANAKRKTVQNELERKDEQNSIRQTGNRPTQIPGSRPVAKSLPANFLLLVEFLAERPMIRLSRGPGELKATKPGTGWWQSEA